jgi:hypothetical protein
MAGHRLREAPLQSHWKVVTPIGALWLSGMAAPMTIEVATDGEIFLPMWNIFSNPR